MWLKWLGGGIILFTCVAMGRQKAAYIKKREKQLQDFIQLSHRIETEISYGQTVKHGWLKSQGSDIRGVARISGA